MIDIRRLRFDGKLNDQEGLLFYFSEHGRMISFLIGIIGDKKIKVRVTMQPDNNHERPHVHLGKHEASFAIDSGELLVGTCNPRVRRNIEHWIHRHRNNLILLWEIAKRGKNYEPVIETIRQEKSFSEYGFKGNEPENIKILKGVKIWYNGNIHVDEIENGFKVVCDGDMFVGVPLGYDDSGMTYESRNGRVHIKRE